MSQRPRAWSDPEGCSSTIVLYDPHVDRPDLGPRIYMHTNLGWVPLGFDVHDARGPEIVAEELGKGYGLQEVSESKARWLSGAEDDEVEFDDQEDE